MSGVDLMLFLVFSRVLHFSCTRMEAFLVKVFLARPCGGFSNLFLFIFWSFLRSGGIYKSGSFLEVNLFFFSETLVGIWHSEPLRKLHGPGGSSIDGWYSLLENDGEAV